MHGIISVEPSAFTLIEICAAMLLLTVSIAGSMICMQTATRGLNAVNERLSNLVSQHIERAVLRDELSAGGKDGSVSFTLPNTESALSFTCEQDGPNDDAASSYHYAKCRRDAEEPEIYLWYPAREHTE